MTVSSLGKCTLQTSAQTKPSEPASVKNKCHMPPLMADIVLAITGGYYQTLSTKASTLLGEWSSFTSIQPQPFEHTVQHINSLFIYLLIFSNLSTSKSSVFWEGHKIIIKKLQHLIQSYGKHGCKHIFPVSLPIYTYMGKVYPYTPPSTQTPTQIPKQSAALHVNYQIRKKYSVFHRHHVLPIHMHLMYNGEYILRMLKYLE